ncbi:hypothetical protein GCM10022407_09970 [Hymenobacter antarcticus]|uniref:KTSC domain-containing protein n=1 Tax=Hymenobacter antarcticus TaxID=486270 RepID=A0ABP7PH30_9BACT
MKIIAQIIALTWLSISAGCISSKLVQHNREYDTAIKPSSVQVYFATTKEQLVSIWGNNQRYYYVGSDADFHYINLYYDTYLKKKYYYKIPSTTKIDNTLFDFLKNNSLAQPQRIEFSLNN